MINSDITYIKVLFLFTSGCWIKTYKRADIPLGEYKSIPFKDTKGNIPGIIKEAIEVDE